MALKDDLEKEVARIFREQWTERDGRSVPEPEDLGLGNDAVKLDATVLYADMSGSTALVDQEPAHFAAEVYRSYLTCAARVVKANDGAITAYDGDRIMAVFIGERKNSRAAKSGLQINWAVQEIVNPALARHYANKTYRLAHVVGIDTSPLFVARIGVRNDNDLVWVGRAANYAAKLSAIDQDNTVFITDSVFRGMADDVKFGGTGKQLMWEQCTWNAMGGATIHRSKWRWAI